MKIKQYNLTVASGKRLIAKAVMELPSFKKALQENTIVILGGTTNSYLAEEVLTKLNQLSGFARERFFRGINLPLSYEEKDFGEFIGDVVLVKGKWQKGLDIFEAVDNLDTGDIIIKGANAVNLEDQEAAVMIGHPKAGTIGVSMLAIAGRRVELIIPVGLEKRITENIGETAKLINSANATGPRYFPIKGNLITELEAIKTLTGAEAKLIAAGGVSGAEGSCRIAVSGSDQELAAVDNLINQVIGEAPFVL